MSNDELSTSQLKKFLHPSKLLKFCKRIFEFRFQKNYRQKTNLVLFFFFRERKTIQKYSQSVGALDRGGKWTQK